jgi:hypothetical protein
MECFRLSSAVILAGFGKEIEPISSKGEERVARGLAQRHGAGRVNILHGSLTR